MTIQEEFKLIPGLPGYSICLLTGRVRNDATGRELRPCWGRAGSRHYSQFSICGKTHRLHRLVAAAAAGRELTDDEQVCHIDGNTANNSVSNLRIGTARENAKDRIAHNTNGFKLKNQDIRDIRMLGRRLACSEIAVRFGVSTGHIRSIISGRCWAGLA